MNIFIAGGGRVGFHLAKLLSGERQNVTLIELRPERVEQIDYALDVSTAIGDGSSVLLMQELGVGASDLFVAATGKDEVNLIAAATAKGLGAKRVVARVDNPLFIESNILYETVLGLDYIMSPDALTALEIANYIECPGVTASADFGRGLVQMRQIRVAATPHIDGRPLRDLVEAGSGVLIGVAEHKGESVIPHGDFVVQPGDHVTLIGRKEDIAPVQKLFLGDEAKPRRVAIMGGGTICFRLAKSLEGRVKSVKIFEPDEKLAQDLAAKLTKAKVVCRSGASRSALEQEHIDTVDVFVAGTKDDEKNIMAGVLAKEVGAKTVISVVHQPDFAPLVERLGVDMAVTPRACMANRILKLVHQDTMTSLAVLNEGQVEVVEFEIDDGSPMLGKQLKDINSKFPRGALIATILRGEQVIVPSGDDVLHAGDSVVLIAASDALDAAYKLLKKK